MKSTIMLLSILVLSVLNSQESKTIAKIIYQETIDMSEGILFKEECMLLFDKNSSFYEVIDKDIDDVAPSETTEFEKEQGMQRNHILRRKKGIKTFFYNHQSKDFYCQSVLGETNLIFAKEENNKIDWKIMDEFKDISGFKCQKATGFFRGREYTAWFTLHIPVPFGPWKLHGLPGLILEAYDTDQMIYLITKYIFTDSDVSLSDKVRKIDFNKAISMSERFEKEKEFQQEVLNQINAQLPKGMKPFKWDEKCEDCPKPLEIFD